MKPRIKILDIIIILLVITFTLLASYFAYMKPLENSQVLIRGLGGDWLFPVEAEEIIVVPGPLGNTTVRIQQQRAWVESSPCENQNCVTSGFIALQGQWAACLPNNVLILIQGDSGEVSDVDAVVW